MSEEPRITIWEAKNNLDYRDYILPTSAQFVDLTAARGEYLLQANLYNPLGINK